MSNHSGTEHNAYEGFFEIDLGKTHYGTWKLFHKKEGSIIVWNHYVLEYFVIGDVSSECEDDFILTYDALYEDYNFDTFLTYLYYTGKCNISSLRKKMREQLPKSRLKDIEISYKPDIDIMHEQDIYEVVERNEGEPYIYDNKKIFIVHGHDNEMKQHVARIINNLGLKPIILHELRNRGRTIIEKFEEEASDVGYAIILLSPEDEGRSIGKNNYNPRARQNVIFEHGFFIGKLGRERVVALYRQISGFELPSDLYGVLYIPYNSDSIEWAYKICDELKELGYDVSKDRL